MSNDEVIDLRHLPTFLLETRQSDATVTPVSKNTLAALDDFNLYSLESGAIRAALVQSGNNRTHAAELLGISRRTLQRKIKELGL